MTEPGNLPEAEFQQIEEFISRTPRGREFLREHMRHAQTGVAEEVRVLVSDLRDLWRQQADANNLVNRVQVLRHELQDMSASISQARREIAALRPSEDGNDRFSTASNELDAIIVSTERASSEILTSSERILELIGKLRDGGDDTADLHSKIEAEVMEIFTACSFQDLTGQRTTKVINVLRYIEQRIGSMIAIWGEDKSPRDDLPPDPVDDRPDSHLLHGPSLTGIDQNEVDQLMSGFAVATPSAAPPPPPKPRPEVKPIPIEEEEPAPTPLNQSAIDALFG
jgi:chemotaxis regulatin CheY-phosphate phosphatase CheZ